MTDNTPAPVVTSYRETDWHALFQAPDGSDETCPVHAWNVQADGAHVALVVDEYHGPTPVTEIPDGHIFQRFISAEDVKLLEELPEVVMAANPAYDR
ncbi:hypothetical protein ACFXPT_11805 [Streptomyces goshikiensis]|uniref:hypothetical protein n=1 Tax=Streptomyces goshikiensis TaxID=1942 RepID=UPI00369E7860